MKPTRLELAIIVLGWLAAIAALRWLDSLDIAIMAQIFEYILLGLGFNLIFGYAGRASFGHSGFFGIGVYSFALLVTVWHWDLFLAGGVAVVAATATAALIGIPLLRLRGHYLALGTLAFGFVVLTAVTEFSGLTGGTSGISMPGVVPQIGEVFLSLAVLAGIAIFLSLRVRVSRLGRALMAIREDEEAARSVGIAVEWYVWCAFVVSAAVVAVAGVMTVGVSGVAAPALFDMDLNALLLLLVVLGGMGNTWGIVIAAVVLGVLPNLLVGLEGSQDLVYGIVVIVVLLLAPHGLGGWVSTNLSGRRGRLPAIGKWHWPFGGDAR